MALGFSQLDQRLSNAEERLSSTEGRGVLGVQRIGIAVGRAGKKGTMKSCTENPDKV